MIEDLHLAVGHMVSQALKELILPLRELDHCPLLIIQVCFYGLAALGGVPVRIPVLSKAARIPHYFIAMHVALFRGFLRYIRGTQKVAWQREHR